MLPDGLRGANEGPIDGLTLHAGGVTAAPAGDGIYVFEGLDSGTYEIDLSGGGWEYVVDSDEAFRAIEASNVRSLGAPPTVVELMKGFVANPVMGRDTYVADYAAHLQGATRGFDWGAPVGTPVFVAVPGVLEQAFEEVITVDGETGKVARVSWIGDDGNAYVLAHLQNIDPRLLDRANWRKMTLGYGQPIGEVGDPQVLKDNPFAPHVHLGMVRNGEHVDPEPHFIRH